MITHLIENQHMILTVEKAMFWKEQSMLILADLHLGKAAHFRKSGIPISEWVHAKDFLRLEQLIQHFSPKDVLFLGDLFHSEHNAGWGIFQQYIRSKSHLHFHLIMGNHDMLAPKAYKIDNLKICNTLNIEPFSFTHIPEDTSFYNISGHLHPAIQMKGKGRQKVKLPCFYFGARQAIMPAFGNFTGTAKMIPLKDSDVYVIAEDVVMKVN